MKEQLAGKGRSNRRSLSSPSVHRVKHRNIYTIDDDNIMQYTFSQYALRLSTLSCQEVDKTCPQPACWTIR